jgi:hypothetical protein
MRFKRHPVEPKQLRNEMTHDREVTIVSWPPSINWLDEWFRDAWILGNAPELSIVPPPSAPKLSLFF